MAWAKGWAKGWGKGWNCRACAVRSGVMGLILAGMAGCGGLAGDYSQGGAARDLAARDLAARDPADLDPAARDPIVWAPSGPAMGVAPSAGGGMVPLAFDKLVFDIPRGADVGGYSFSLLCAPPYQRMTWVTPRSRDAVMEAVHAVLSGQGYDLVGDPARLFALEEDRMRAEVLLGARISWVRYDLCHAVDLWTGWPQGVQGEASVRVEWSLYSRLDRRMLLKRTTQGRGRLDQPSSDGEYLVLQAAISDAALRLGQDAAFRDALNRDQGQVAAQGSLARTLGTLRAGSRPDASDDSVSGGPDMRPSPAGDVRTLAAVTPVDVPAADPAVQEPGEGRPDGRDLGEGGLPWIELPVLPAFVGPLGLRAERVLQAAVLVAAGAGHGSGVFIDGDGLILTNAHVVGHAERVRVVLADGVALVGTVERLHPRRDVALVRVPRGRYTALPLRLDPPDVSDDVYALGAPLAERNLGTLTRGIVSARRQDPHSGYPLIQADVTVQPGSSGGPLLDASGNLAGLAVSGLGDLSTGINYFIPIADALERLALRPASDGAAR